MLRSQENNSVRSSSLSKALNLFQQEESMILLQGKETPQCGVFDLDLVQSTDISLSDSTPHLHTQLQPQSQHLGSKFGSYFLSSQEIEGYGRRMGGLAMIIVSVEFCCLKALVCFVVDVVCQKSI